MFFLWFGECDGRFFNFWFAKVQFFSENKIKRWSNEMSGKASKQKEKKKWFRWRSNENEAIKRRRWESNGLMFSEMKIVIGTTAIAKTWWNKRFLQSRQSEKKKTRNECTIIALSWRPSTDIVISTTVASTGTSQRHHNMTHTGNRRTSWSSNSTHFCAFGIGYGTHFWHHIPLA